MLDRLGAGGMGTVLKARHRRMKRVVALKVLATALSTDESFVQRFQREVETIARLKHPNIVMAYDADECELGHFLVMEFVDGRDLSSIVAKTGPLDIAQAIDYTLQAARRLTYAHSQQIIHRDIKPANLLLDSTGVVKVTDLGLARLNPAAAVDRRRASRRPAAFSARSITCRPSKRWTRRPSTIGRTFTAWAARSISFSRQATYGGGNAMSILVQHREAAIPSLLSARQDLPPELDDIFQRMVAKNVNDRYSSMAEVVTALEGLAAGPGAALSPAPPTAILPTKSDSSVSMGRPDQKTIVTSPAAVTPLSVLVVEPSRMQARVVRGYLDALQIPVAGVVANGADAIAAVRAQKPGAIVATLYLDDMTGIELAKQSSRASPRSRHRASS